MFILQNVNFFFFTYTLTKYTYREMSVILVNSNKYTVRNISKHQIGRRNVHREIVSRVTSAVKYRNARSLIHPVNLLGSYSIWYVFVDTRVKKKTKTQVQLYFTVRRRVYVSKTYSAGADRRGEITTGIETITKPSVLDTAP